MSQLSIDVLQRNAAVDPLIPARLVHYVISYRQLSLSRASFVPGMFALENRATGKTQQPLCPVFNMDHRLTQLFLPDRYPQPGPFDSLYRPDAAIRHTQNTLPATSQVQGPLKCCHWPLHPSGAIFVVSVGIGKTG